MYDLTHTAPTLNHKIRPVGGPWALVNKMRILASGQILEDIDMHSRPHEMFNVFGGTDGRNNGF